MVRVKRTGILIKPDPARVFFRPFNPTGPERTTRIIARIMALSEEEVEREAAQVLADFSSRHHKLYEFLLNRFEQVRPYMLTDQPVSEARRLLIGAYFTQEYSLEAAALFNPSMVWHPDQSDLAPGSRRFILSLRATGEGHISSITFRSGIIDADNNIVVNEPTRFVAAPEIVPNPSYERALFEKKLYELGLANDFSSQIMGSLGEFFTLAELEASVNKALRQSYTRNGMSEATARGIMSLARSNYEVAYTPEQRLSERIIFPYTPAEINGIEDARFVQFCDEDGCTTYYATYTAYDGEVVLPQLLETTDFLHFKISTLNGPAVQNKGMALFPRKINGLYAMLGRQDNENIYLMFSDHVHFWYTKEIIIKPTFPWEFVQIGNCGSPIETEAGWLVLSHGVGPMRKYAIGAFLLDLDDPARVIGRLREPLLSPDENEREGYVPNVVYSCGGLIHGHELIVPYAMSDRASSFVRFDLDDLLNELLKF
ncbi:MAG: glycoside hydrolase family 130 protein [Anaerolineae bacterium]